MNRVIEVKPGETVEVRATEDLEAKRLTELYVKGALTSAEYLKLKMGASYYEFPCDKVGGITINRHWRIPPPSSRFKPGDRVRVVGKDIGAPGFYMQEGRVTDVCHCDGIDVALDHSAVPRRFREDNPALYPLTPPQT